MSEKIRVLLSEEEVEARIRQIAAKISKDYAGKEVQTGHISAQGRVDTHHAKHFGQDSFDEKLAAVVFQSGLCKHPAETDILLLIETERALVTGFSLFVLFFHMSRFKGARLGSGTRPPAFLAHHIFQLIQSNRQAAFFEVNFFRGSHPEHVLSPLCNSFNIDQMLYSNVFRNRVSAPGAARCV